MGSSIDGEEDCCEKPAKHDEEYNIDNEYRMAMDLSIPDELTVDDTDEAEG